ncbi:DUF2207 domain-containing protein [Streptococcus intermedius]|uniref:DUF2207 domain-containing protein n=1 Tax=Streptococcus intermedius TaxID=1338 RepID=UPI002000E76F|nr:DUF2207 domain-containing protein [Streptococcus intermedius]
MKKFFWGIVIFFSCLFFSQHVLAVSYDIESYKGDLQIHSDNTATFVEIVDYRFSSHYNGQVITLGTSGKVPRGFDVEGKPTIRALKNGQPKTNITAVQERIAGGYKYKIYNAGNKGDRVRIEITWKLKNMLFVYNDIVELHWIPISDWDKKLNNVEFRITPPATSQQTELYAHTGYFMKPAQVTREGDSYLIRVASIARNSNLEFHAYWNRSLITVPENSLAVIKRNWLQEFRRVEREVATDTKRYQKLVDWDLPLALVLVDLISLACYIAFHLSTKPRATFPKHARLYEIPQDLPPMVIASNVFSVDLTELNPTKKQETALKFENLIQATLLDLIDRGNLVFTDDTKQPQLQRVTDKGLSDFEQEFLNMAMGDNNQIFLKNLFSDFKIDNKIYSRGERAVRSAGNRVKNLLQHYLTTITEDIHEIIEREQLPNNYRSVTKKEFLYLYLAMFLMELIAIGSFGVLAWILLIYGLVFYRFAVSFFIAGGMLYYLLRKCKMVKRDGVLNEEGAENYYYWKSFANMLHEIAHLKDTEVEGVILWNRLLVYAAMFNCADKVSKTMKLRKITIDNPSMNAFVYQDMSYDFHTSSHAFVSYGTAANSASSFSVSSSGSSGGGFSGGGGGGGGGAF